MRYISNDTPQSNAPLPPVTRESFDLFDYLDYLGQRWRLVAVASVTAVVLGASLGWLLPKEYTAVATILIEPPDSADPRAATVVSPVYLESLKTFETLASQTSLFAEGVQAVRLTGEDMSSIEGLKRRVLKVNKLRDTRLLEIRVTLHHAAAAQQLAAYIAKRASAIQREQSAAADQERITFATTEAEQSKQHLAEAQQALRQIEQRRSLEARENQLGTEQDLASRLQTQILETEADLAEASSRVGASGSAAREGLSARLTQMRQQLKELSATITKDSLSLAADTFERQQREAKVRLAEANAEAANRQLRDARAAAGTHGERLQVVDSGVVPDRPSSPGSVLLAGAALVLALAGSLILLTIRFAYHQRGRAAYGY